MKKWVIGIDEVGRGPLAGPVYVCAVAIPETMYKSSKWEGLTDSKQMTTKSREKWFLRAQTLEDLGKIKIALSFRSAKMIDQKGINPCIQSCISSAISSLGLDPKDCTVLLDGGLKAPPQYIKQKTIIKGDQKEKAISLASVIAKVTRDHYMRKVHSKYPQYNWINNKGYGTRAHVLALKNKGFSELHRQSYLKKVLDR